jgi:hypothetical protein
MVVRSPARGETPAAKLDPEDDPLCCALAAEEGWPGRRRGPRATSTSPSMKPRDPPRSKGARGDHRRRSVTIAGDVMQRLVFDNSRRLARPARRRRRERGRGAPLRFLPLHGRVMRSPAPCSDRCRSRSRWSRAVCRWLHRYGEIGEASLSDPRPCCRAADRPVLISRHPEQDSTTTRCAVQRVPALRVAAGVPTSPTSQVKGRRGTTSSWSRPPPLTDATEAPPAIGATRAATRWLVSGRAFTTAPKELVDSAL